MNIMPSITSNRFAVLELQQHTPIELLDWRVFVYAHNYYMKHQIRWLLLAL